MISTWNAVLRPLSIASVVLALGCAGGEPAADAPSPEPPTAPVAAAESPAEVWWQRIHDLCGQAFEGRLVSDDAADERFVGQTLTMHVRRCEAERIEIPLHVGEDRSRTWVLRLTEAGIHLQHDHRHEDGSEDPVTLYGGTSVDEGDAGAQSFPADDYSRELFEQNDLGASVANIWRMEIVPGERFSYILRRPGRHFRADFDLARPVEPPPAPWGHD